MSNSSSDPNPIAPGEIIRAGLRSRGWGQEDLARILGRPLGRVNEIIQGKQAISVEIAVALATAFGNTPTEWLEAEAAYRLSLVKADTEGVRRRARVYEIAPVKEMQKRGWIAPTDSDDELEGEVLRFFQVESLDEPLSVHGAMRKTAPNVPATQGQRAWAFRVRQLAGAIPPASVVHYDESRLTGCQVAIRKLAAYSKEVRKVPALLMDYGIRLVVVEGLSGAKVDGFATWLDEKSPVIGMSLRFDRLDSFWFTLGHELTHIKYRDIAPVDVDVSGQENLLEVKPEMERRADAESAAMFVDPDELQSFIRRNGPRYSAEQINQFANRIKMHPNIIVGQLKALGEIKYSQHNKTIVPIRDLVIKAAVTDGWGKSINIGENP